MKLSKTLICCNVVVLMLNAIIIGLMTAKQFPPFLGICLLLVFFGTAVWFSCLVDGKLPNRRPQPRSFYSALTEKVERI